MKTTRLTTFGKVSKEKLMYILFQNGNNGTQGCSHEIKSSHRLVQAGCAALMLAALGAQAAPPTYNTTSAGVYYVSNSGSGSVSSPNLAQYNYPYTSGQNSGYAGLSGTTASGAPLIATGSYASSGNGDGWVNTDAYFQTSMLVGAGTSGLANGTPVTIQLSLQLDGSTSVTSGDDAGFARMDFSYSIESPDQAVYNPSEGDWMVPNIVSFGANVDHSTNNFYTYYYSPAGWYHDTSYSSEWSWGSNLASGSGGIVNDYTVVPGVFSSTDSRTFDTGLVQIDFQTFVGDTLNINSYLDVWGDTYGAGSAATADFLNTLNTSITSPYVAGLELIPGTTGSIVPVPPAVWLFGSGLLGLIGIARRKTV